MMMIKTWRSGERRGKDEAVREIMVARRSREKRGGWKTTKKRPECGWLSVRPDSSWDGEQTIEGTIKMEAVSSRTVGINVDLSHRLGDGGVWCCLREHEREKTMNYGERG